MDWLAQLYYSNYSLSQLFSEIHDFQLIHIIYYMKINHLMNYNNLIGLLFMTFDI